jgi:hypothetical protein
MRRLFATVLISLASSLCAQQLPGDLFHALEWRFIGPFRGGRVLAATGVIGQPNVFYFGSVGGGVWKSENAGLTWAPIFDANPIASIGAIEVAPSNPQVIYVGTGEAGMRSDIGFGDGIYNTIPIPTSYMWQRSVTRMDRTTSVACTGPPMAGASGRNC